MSDQNPGERTPDEGDEAAQALTVVSVQKEQNLRVELSTTEGEGPSADPPSREGAYAFKAGSSLPEDRVEALNVSQVFLVRFNDELYAINTDDVRLAFPQLAAQHAWKSGTIDLREKLEVRAAFTRNAVPELIKSVGTTNIVRYDGYFYLLPQDLGAVRWGEEDVARMRGVRVVSNARDAFVIAEGGTPVPPQPKTPVKAPVKVIAKETGKERSVPLLRKTVDNYNIVEYEGWFYGLPHSLGPIDLQKTDVIEMPRVIRDVSADVVEREILELRH